MSEPRDIEVHVPGLTLAAQRWGRPEGPKVLALHGWLDNAATFEGVAPLLPELDLVALDMPGHGRSEHRHMNDTYHFIDWIPDVVAAADDLGWEQFALVGHSMGGAVASMVAGTVPERVTSLVLIDGIAPLTGEAEGTPESLATFVQQRRRLLDKERPIYPSREVATERLLKVAGDISEESARRLVARNTRETPAGVEWTYDQRLRRISPMRFTEAHVQAFLRRISAPVLFVRPSRGYELQASIMEGWLAAIPKLQRVGVEGGHHVHLDEPRRVVPALRDFLLG